MPRRETTRLWLFAPPGLASIAPGLNNRYRWAHLFKLPQDERPAWSVRLGGEAWLVNEGSGDYQGCFGFPARRLVTVDEAAARIALKGRHHGWTEAKLRRAADQAARTTAHETDRWGRSTLDEREIRAFLEDATVAGPVTFVLDDGGLVSPEEGGSRGQDAGSIGLRSEAAIGVDLAVGGLDRAIPPPYWTPVTFR